MQRAFQTCFMLHQNDDVTPDRKFILLCLKNFRTIGLSIKRMPFGRPQSTWTLKNVQIMRQSVLQSLTLSTCKHASA